MKINKRSTQTRGRMAAGFTLLEMVIVLGIIALILGAAISFSGGITEAARIQAAEAKSREFSAKLETYRMLAGVYPSETQGLQALVEKPTSAPEPKRWKAQFKALPKDPWGQDYVYHYPGRKDTSTYEILSKGADMEEGTEDDISSQDYE
jgi:general secretion pathway protein G